MEIRKKAIVITTKMMSRMCLFSDYYAVSAGAVTALGCGIDFSTGVAGRRRM